MFGNFPSGCHKIAGTKVRGMGGGGMVSSHCTLDCQSILLFPVSLSQSGCFLRSAGRVILLCRNRSTKGTACGTRRPPSLGGHWVPQKRAAKLGICFDPRNSFLQGCTSSVKQA